MATLAGLAISLDAHAGTPPEPVDRGAPRPERALQLEVFVNGHSTDMIAAFRQENETLLIEPEQLRKVGLVPVTGAAQADGLIDVRRLPDVTFMLDDAGQTIHFTAAQKALVRRTIDARVGEDTLLADPQTSVGAVVNYTLYASTGGERIDGLFDFEGASGLFEGRLFGPYGTMSGQVLVTASNRASDMIRLDTTWSFSDQRRMLSYRAGDVITGGLGWTRPVRLGGVQVQRNFALRPDLVTFPLPELAGSAAVPSTVELFVNNARYLSEDVQAGPFAIRNIPAVTGAGIARVVVRDVLGRESVSEVPFYASAELLAPDLTDFSVEAGFTRQFFGLRSNDYDSRPIVSATARHGLNHWLTLESHAEVGGSLANGGAGAAFGIGTIGVGTVAAAASRSDRGTGGLVAASFELRHWGLQFFARTQRTFGDYDDIASVTADDFHLPPAFDAPVRNASPPKALDQVSLSLPLPFDPTTANFSYTQFEIEGSPRSRIVGASLTRSLGGKASLFVNSFADLEDNDSWGVFAGLSIALGRDIHAFSNLSQEPRGTSVSADLFRSERDEIGSVGWRVHASEGAETRHSAEIAYRSPFARLAGSIERSGDASRATAQADGAIVVAGGGVFASGRIDDAFAVVDAGAPDVGVRYENQPIGVTGPSGKLLVPRLRSYQRNRIEIDPVNLPIDARVDEVRKVTVPADRSGTVVRFAVDAEPEAALVTFTDESGAPLPVGSMARIEGRPNQFVIGYDGQAWLSGLITTNRALVEMPDGSTCAAGFAYRPRRGEQVRINVSCRRNSP